MEFKDGTSVYTFDGKKAGSLRRVVIDPEKQEVTHIVVEKGLLSRDDKVVAVENVESTSPERISLTCSIEALDEMPPLEIEEFVPSGGVSGGEQRLDPMAGGFYGNQPVQVRPSSVMTIHRTIPDELVALKEGAHVISLDDRHMGNVEHLYTDPQTGKITHFLATQGVLVKTRKSIPFPWVKLITDDEVYLTVEAKQLEALPDVEG